MANTYTQLYAHVVFAVKGRDHVISPKWKENLFKYINGIITNKDQKLMVINGMPDHLHLLIGFNPDCRLSDLVRDIKANSSRWINENHFIAGRFEWQTGFGAFSIGQSQIDKTVKYILNQEEHHSRKTFKEEYIEFLIAYHVDYKQEYVFDDYGFAPLELDRTGME
jgi:putative transposase